MKKYIELIRVKHWIKNILIFIPIISANLITENNLIKVVFAFFAFSFMSSFIYIINDIRDIEKDKQHPRKKLRPLPSGKLKISTAIIIAILMLIISLIINFLINNSFINISFIILLAYMLINLAYSFGFKDIAILDIVLLASGFILRVYYGASVIDITVSDWLFLTILNASLFLGLGKRKKELVHKSSRKVLNEYNEAFLDKFQYLTLGLMLVFYSFWTMEQSINYFVFTIPLVLIIFMKYCLIIEKSDEGDPTTILYHDKSLLALCCLYGILMFVFLLVI